MPKKELSRHANIVVYLGTHYEDLLKTRLNGKGTDLLKLMKSVKKSIPHGLQVKLTRFVLFMRNPCAHEKGFKSLSHLDEVISFFNSIEDDFAAIIPGYIPDYFSESDFHQDSSRERVDYVDAPTEKTVYIHHFVLPRLVSAGLWLIGVACFLGLFFGGFTSSDTKTNKYSTGPFWPFKTDHQDTYTSNDPNALFWIIVVGAIVSLIGYFVWRFTWQKQQAPTPNESKVG